MRSQRTRTRSSAAEAPAYLTVFLTLSLTIILSLILTLIEGARIYAIRMQAECVVRTAMDSCLAEYNRVLQERYDLFYVDTTYGTGAGSELDLQSHLESYMSKNLSRSTLSDLFAVRDLTALSVSECEVTQCRYACDGGLVSLREQIEAYMTAGPEAALVEGFLSLYETALGYDGDEWESAFESSSEAFEEALEALEEEEDDEDRENEEGDGHTENRESLQLLLDILGEIREVLGRSALDQVLGGGVSDASADGERLLSERTLHYGTAYSPDNSHDYDEVGSMLMTQYILEKFGNYSEALDNCVLQYEVEYILFGQHDDRENLEQMTGRLLLLRAAANLAAIHGVGQCTATADAIGALLNLFPGIPATVTRELVLTIWAYAEAIQDVRTLYAGGKVPIVKSASNWKTTFTGLFSSGGGDAGGSGIGYATYLRIFLLAQDRMDPVSTTERVADLIELDVTKEQEGIPLFLDDCLDAMQVDVRISSGFGYTCEVIQDITYN